MHKLCGFSTWETSIRKPHKMLGHTHTHTYIQHTPMITYKQNYTYFKWFTLFGLYAQNQSQTLPCELILLGYRCHLVPHHWSCWEQNQHDLGHQVLWIVSSLSQKMLYQSQQFSPTQEFQHRNITCKHGIRRVENTFLDYVKVLNKHYFCATENAPPS